MEDNKLEKEESLACEVVVENKEELKEEVVNEEIINEETTDKSENFNNELQDGNQGFLKRVLSGIIDQIVSIAISLIILVVFDAIIRLIGFYIAEREPMFLIIYIITNVIYRPILETSKLKGTIGRKLIK